VLGADWTCPDKVDTPIRTEKGSEVVQGKETTRLRRTFNPQFKKLAVRLVVEEGKSLTEVAAHLGIARRPLQRWREELSSNPAPEVFTVK
jgi:transposase-like protein